MKIFHSGIVNLNCKSAPFIFRSNLQTICLKSLCPSVLILLALLWYSHQLTKLNLHPFWLLFILGKNPSALPLKEDCFLLFLAFVLQSKSEQINAIHIDTLSTDNMKRLILQQSLFISKSYPVGPRNTQLKSFLLKSCELNGLYS